MKSIDGPCRDALPRTFAASVMMTQGESALIELVALIKFTYGPRRGSRGDMME